MNSTEQGPMEQPEDSSMPYRPLPPIRTIPGPPLPIHPPEPIKPERVLLNGDQLMHWRRVLVRQYGLLALLLPDSEIQKLRDEMQEAFGGDAPSVPESPESDGAKGASSL